MEGWDEVNKGNIKKRNPITEGGGGWENLEKKEKNTVHSRIVVVLKSKRNI